MKDRSKKSRVCTDIRRMKKLTERIVRHRPSRRSRAMTTDADEETIDAIETFGLAGADADAIARGGCGKLGRIKTLDDDALNQLRLNERTERLTTTTDDARVSFPAS